MHAIDDLAIEDDNSIPRYWNLRTVPLVGTRGGGTLLVIEDQTRQRVLELHYVRAEKLAALGTMAAGMAHEIKNPSRHCPKHLRPACLTYIPMKIEERTTALQAMRDAIRRIDQHITNLLDFARLPEDPKAPVDVVRVLEQLLDLENRHADHLGIAIQRQLQPMPLVSINAGYAQGHLPQHYPQCLPSHAQRRSIVCEYAPYPQKAWWSKSATPVSVFPPSGFARYLIRFTPPSPPVKVLA